MKKGRKLLSLLLSAVMVISVFAGIGPVTAFAEGNEEVTGKLVKQVEDYICFGSYPQTEIVGSASQSGVYGKSWAQEGDYEVNADLYSELQSAAWDANNDYVATDGKKYRKLTAPTYKTTASDNFYSFASGSTHYFRYEPVKWRVLSQDGDDAFLLSEIALDDQRYNSNNVAVTWETCSLRTWLNNDFYNSAFTSAEQSAIKTTTVVNSNSIFFGTAGGNNTSDKVFLLSESEVSGTGGEANGFANDINTNDSARMAKSSTYAKAMGVYTNTVTDYMGNCMWWTRSPGASSDCATQVTAVGTFHPNGDLVFYYDRAIRPALHLNLTCKSAYTIKYKTVEALEIDEDDVTLSFSETTYNGEAQEPEVIIEGLTIDEDYAVDYENNVNAGTGTVIITGCGSFSGSITKEFTIKPADISTVDFVLNGEYVYFGSYPQTEIVESASQSGVYGKPWAQESDYEVNAELYSELQYANWNGNNDYVASDGKKYRRLNAPTYSHTGIDSYYEFADWSDHYFRYEPIKWRILSQEEDDVLLLSEIALDSQMYNSSDTDVTWETCSLRTWLNSDFYSSAFEADEQNAIMTTTVINGDNIEYGTTGGNSTQDKVFLLSEAEVYGAGGVENGFANDAEEEDSARRAKSSTYAKAMGVWLYKYNDGVIGNCTWWLRSPGMNSNRALYVDVSGNIAICSYGSSVNLGNYAVRPALHLDLNSIDAYNVSLSFSETTYNGEAQEPEVSVEGLTYGEDYTVEYKNNTNAGTGTATIIAQGNYGGELPVTFTIDAVDISAFEGATTVADATYTGECLEPEVTIEGLDAADYDVEYYSNRYAGTGYVEIFGKGNYTGGFTKYFTIAPADISKLKMSVTGTTKTYTGKALAPTVKITGLISGVDFTVSTATKVGKHKITVEGQYDYAGTKTAYLTINPKKPSVSKLTVGKTGSRKLTVKMGTKVSATGGTTYKVQYRVKGTSSWTTKTTTSQTITLKSLKKGKTYQVRVQAYKKSGNTTFAGDWSAIKTSGKIK